eukprot:scaffold4046_cov123-Chaetoceros_neogracile.AAC.2
MGTNGFLSTIAINNMYHDTIKCYSYSSVISRLSTLNPTIMTVSSWFHIHNDNDRCSQPVPPTQQHISSY